MDGYKLKMVFIRYVQSAILNFLKCLVYNFRPCKPEIEGPHIAYSTGSTYIATDVCIEQRWAGIDAEVNGGIEQESS